MCIDCWREFKDDPGLLAKAMRRKETANPGRRCASHWSAERQRIREQAHARRMRNVYGLNAGEYQRLYEFQGGHCAICLRARGVAKKLAVDHDHRSGRVRGLLCSICNSLLGHSRDDPELFRRAFNYLINPPAAQAGITAVYIDQGA